VPARVTKGHGLPRAVRLPLCEESGGNNGSASLPMTAGAYSFPDTTRSFIDPAYPRRNCAPATESGYLIALHDTVLVFSEIRVSIFVYPVSGWLGGAPRSGTWTPGQQPQLEQTLSAEVVEALFNVTPSENSGRNQVQIGDTLYAMVFRRISR
jgi:hypothetical protein